MVRNTQIAQQIDIYVILVFERSRGVARIYWVKSNLLNAATPRFERIEGATVHIIVIDMTAIYRVHIADNEHTNITNVMVEKIRIV